MGERKQGGGQRPGPPAALDREDAEFKEAMALFDASGSWPALSDRALSEKTETPADVAAKAAKKTRKREVIRLDLHGCSIEEGLERLERFLVEAMAKDRRRALVITGRGRRSPGGVPILRRKVGEWLRREGAPWVREVETAPREFGGDGAWMVHLRRPRPR